MKPAAKKDTEDGPIEIRRGSFVARIYRRTRKIRKGKYELWTLAYYEPGGRRRVRDFGSVQTAKDTANEVASTFGLVPPDASRFSAEERQQFDAASQVLAPWGLNVYSAAVELVDAKRKLPKDVSVTTAIDDYVRRHPANAPFVTVPQAVEALIADRTEAKASDSHRKKLGSVLRRFAKAFTGSVSSVSPTMVDEWLKSLEKTGTRTGSKKKTGPREKIGNRTRANYRMTIVTLFRFAHSKRWVSRDLADEIAEIPKPKVEAVGEVGIFSPAEISRILAAAPDDIRASLAIGAFAGLRTQEVHRLEWADVRLGEGVIIVGARKSKTKSRRVVPISENLSEWLAPIVPREGRIDPSPTSKATTHRWRRIGERVGLKWRHNALRHSFCSYRLAVTHDPAKVAFEAGNSPAMLDRHYRALVTEKEGREWFGIVPPKGEPAEIISMTAT